jgi:hypothetical protein
MFAPMRQTRGSTPAEHAKLLYLIATSSLEQHGYELDHDALLNRGGGGERFKDQPEKIQAFSAGLRVYR